MATTITGKFTVLLLTGALAPLASANNVDLADTPLNMGMDVAPLVMLVMGRDHTLFYEAYNDASDLDGDGVVDYVYKPSEIDYDGYFDSHRCYTYANEQFSPAQTAIDKKCSGQWSGDFLNYLTMSRVDLLRKVLYGGRRSTDTSSATVLERAYIPIDAHSWAKAYISEAVSGYDIAEYAPFSQPSANHQHFFGTASFSINGKPELVVLQNQGSKSSEANKRCDVWNWASTERPVLRIPPIGNCANDATEHRFTVRVQVCQPGKLEANCKSYPNGNYKPIGLLHEFGENNAMEFGLLSGSYMANKSGGVLRHNIKNFDEVNADDGTFKTGGGLVATINDFKIRGFQSNGTYKNQLGGGSWVTTRAMKDGEFIDWGNPVGEMLYESVRYFNDLGKPTSNFIPQKADSLAIANWGKPYSDLIGSEPRLYCARPNNLVISDIYPSFDADQLPGALIGSGLTGDLPNFSAKDLLAKISAQEGIDGDFFIGHSGVHTGLGQGAPTAKRVNNLNNIYGLAPNEPTKEGSYSSAAAAYYGRITDLFPNEDGHQGIATTVVGISSPLPEIIIPIDDKTIRLVPFAKSTNGYSIDRNGKFQPTNTIVDFYVQELTKTKGVFRINFEDVEQAADHDMDMIVTYSYEVKGDLCPIAGESCQPEERRTGVEVKLSSDYAAGSIHQHAGYVVSGTEHDGIYLDVLDRPDGGNKAPVTYYLDTISPDDRPYPNNFRTIGSEQQKKTVLTYNQTRHFFPSASGVAAKFLPSPLLYAAKYGGVVENEQQPELITDWDSDGDGVPDNYFPVTNAGELGDSLRRAFENIASQDSPSASTFNSQFLTAGAVRFQSSYESADWSGDLRAFAANDKGGFASNAKWSAAEQLDQQSVAERKVFSVNSDSNKRFSFVAPTSTTALDGQANGFSLSQVNALLDGKSGNNNEQLKYLQAVVNYLRGERTHESSDSHYSMRARGSVLGDIVNSTPYVVNSVNGHQVNKEVIIAGGNDGMVHLFDLDSGNELMAYVPSEVYRHLGSYVKLGYQHKFFVDGNISGYSDTDGTTVVGTLGHGAKGLYALDVSNLNTINGNVIKWEITSKQANYSQIGYTRAQPTIAKLANSDVGVIFPNGFNAGGDGAIYIADLDDGKLIKKLSVGKQTDPTGLNRPNALAEPAVLDLNGDGIADRIYAGDLFGNLWVFDISHSDPNNWGVATTSGKPLFTAQSPMRHPNGSSGFSAQPITSRPSFAVHPFGLNRGVLVSFGTGLYVGHGDAAATDQITQSFYTIWDKLNNAAVDDKRSGNNGSGQYGKLLQQRIVEEVDGKRTLTNHVINWHQQQGFYIDLINTDNNNRDNLGERQVTTSLSLTDTVSFTTLMPNADACSSGGDGWFMQLNLHTGALEQSDKFNHIPPAPSVIVKPPAGVGDSYDPSNPNAPCDKDCDSKQLIYVGDKVFEDQNPPLGLLDWRRLF
ncbi:pilus assembly protein [Ferrimonas senticii]|uniref:pilus assembly protein n=1 Tax=Ferrimonas senticii TaxID=394566 RepID=UPI00041FF44D|nr:PilC/PilY family type IV pilus protein [Ferrimonas senticii]